MFRWFYPIFVAFWFGVFVYFAYPVVKYSYHNVFLNASIEPKSAHWSVREIQDEKWAPEVKYSFDANGALFEKNEIFQGYSYRNPYVAKDALQEIITSHPVVWYSPTNPENSTMEKYFPKKQATYAGIILLLFVYFNYGLYTVLKHRERWKQ